MGRGWSFADQYSGWSNKAQVATLQRWISARVLLEQVRRIKATDLSVAADLTAAKVAMRNLMCFTFSEYQRFPAFRDAVNISKGGIKTNLNKVMLLTDKCYADNATSDAHPVVEKVIGNRNGGGDFDFSRPRIALRAALDAIEDELLEGKCFVSREALENELGITWQEY